MTTKTTTATEGSPIHREVKQNGMSNGNIDKQSNGTVMKQGTDEYRGKLPAQIGTDFTYKRKIVWFNAIGFLVLHLVGLYGFYLSVTAAKWLTFGWMGLLAYMAGEGITIGAHRLYSHKSFKAHLLLRLGLIILQTVAGQNCLYIWVRDHRQHHKYSDTDADPHNAKRGFFFSHIGWLMSKKHPAVISKGKTLDMSDLEADPIVMFQKKYYKSLYILFSIALPTVIPVYFWDETYYNSLFVTFFARTILLLNITWSVNSAAHIWGTRPFDKFLQPVESKLVAFLSIGEGWHNYHHAFPWDYRASELGSRWNITAYVIQILSQLGLAYDLRVASDHMIKHRVKKAGDGTHHKYGFLSDEIPQAEEDLDEKYVQTLKEFGVFGGTNVEAPHAVQGSDSKSC